MADAGGRSSRKPVSLNDRHYRLLQDLSSAPPKPKPSIVTEEEEQGDIDGAGRRRNSGFGFSEFGDFDLPPSQGEDTDRAGGRRFDGTRTYGSGDFGAPSFSGFVDFDSPRDQPVAFPEGREKKDKGSSFHDQQRRHSLEASNLKTDEVDASLEDNGEASYPGFSGIPNLDSPEGQGEEEKHGGKFGDPIGSFEDDDTCDPLFYSTLDSCRQGEPTKVKLKGRRRLCKASSRGHGSTEDVELVLDECKDADIADFNSPVPPKLKGHKENNLRGCEIRDILNDLSSKLDRLTIEKKKFPEANAKLPLNIGYDDAETSREDCEDDANVHDFDAEIAGEDCEDDANVHDFDAEIAGEDCKDDVNLLRGCSDEGELDGSVMIKCSREEFARVQDNNKTSHAQNKGKSKIVSEKVRYAGRSCPSNLRDEDEEEDDCQVFSDKGIVKELKHGRARGTGSFDYSNVVDLSNDSKSGSVAVEEDCLTLSGPVSTFKLPGKIAKILYPHQREGLQWLWALHCQEKGGILGDDMGLGKTMQICGFLAGLFHSKLIKRALVVAPKTLLAHWIKELSIVGLSGKTREYFGTSTKVREYELQYILQDKGVLLTTYDIVRNNSKSLKGSDNFVDDDEDGFNWDYMILDEGHLIKNPSTQRAKSLLEIPSVHRIVISGTPIQNNLKELWALFNFCCPGLLGDHKWFKEKYENRILKGNEKKASDREKRIGSAVAKELRERIQPYFLRRMKNEVFKEDDEDSKLSKKNEIIVWLRLTACQRQLYEAFLQSELVLSAFDGSPLAALTILKKICDHPLLLTKRAAEDVLEGMDSMLNQEDACMAEKLAMHIADYADRDAFEAKHDSVSCKISFIMSLLDNLIPQGHRILIFSQTRKMLNLIEESLFSNGYKFLRIDGTTKASDRVKVVNDFQEGFGAPIFLLTSQVGGLGLTLTRADRVIVVDPAWNPSTDNQSVDRAYRIGQTKDVIVYRLMTCGTVEEKIYRKQIFKGGLFKSATEHKEQIRYFSQQDLKELFSLPKQGFNVSVTQQQLHEEHDSQYTMDESLERHIEFLETKGIAGVSHHSLLFSKSAPVQAVTEDEAEEIRRGTTFAGNAFSRTSVEPAVDGARYAFNPKDVKPRKFLSPEKEDKVTESQIKERINRLSQLLENKVTVSRLPDGGAKLRKQMAELNTELNKIRMEKRNENEVIDVDEISGTFSRALNV